MSAFKLKNNRTYRIAYGLPKTPETISNANMTKAKALKFLSQNTAERKDLFSQLPKNIDELLNPKSKKDEPTKA